MTTRKDVEYMENEIQKNTKLSHDIYNCLIAVSYTHLDVYKRQL